MSRPGRGGPARGGAVLLGAVLLAGCAGPPPPAPPPPVAPPPPRSEPAGARPGLAAFEQAQRARAEAAARAGRWFEAQAAWDVVLALAPDDAPARRGLAQAQASARAALAELLPRAREARRRGDLAAAQSRWLEVLELDPQHEEAAEALRAIETERVRRRLAARPPAGAFARRMLPPAGTAATRAPAGRNTVEHASLLAQQGEIDAAITLLRPLAEARRPDPAARALLASLYLRQADRLAASDPKAAIEALERGLRIDPGDPQLAGRLRALKAAEASRARPAAQGTVKPSPAGR